MQVLSFLTQKGGPGKSTLTASVAVAAFEEGRRVFILELDKQGTMSEWYETRQAEDGPDFERIESTNIAAALETLRVANYDLVVIDTPGADNPHINLVMRASDFCLIPSRPTKPDLRGCVPTVEALMRLNKPFAFVLNQCLPGRSPRADEARAGLAALGYAAEPSIVSRTDHQDAIAAGQGVTEFNPTGPAAQEIRQLLAWVSAKLSPITRKSVTTKSKSDAEAA